LNDIENFDVYYFEYLMIVLQEINFNTSPMLNEPLSKTFLKGTIWILHLLHNYCGRFKISKVLKTFGMVMKNIFGTPLPPT